MELKQTDTRLFHEWTVVEIRPDTRALRLMPDNSRLFADDVWARAQSRFPLPRRLTLEERREIAAELDAEFRRYMDTVRVETAVRTEAEQPSACCTSSRCDTMTGEPHGLGKP